MRIQPVPLALILLIVICAKLQLHAGYVIRGIGLMLLRMALVLCVISLLLDVISVPLIARAVYATISIMSIQLLITFAPIVQYL